MNKPKFNIGDVVWHATYERIEKRITCPDCLGKKTLTMIMGNGTQVVIDCELCTRHWENGQSATGEMIVYEYGPRIWPGTITGVEVERDGIRYYPGYGYEGKDVFATKEKAEARTRELCEQHTKEELEAFGRKYRASRNWAWNVSYHRDEIRRAEKNLAYHRLKLAVAETKVQTEGRNDTR